MACSIYTLQGIVQDCMGNIGGVSEVWLAHYDSVTAATATTYSEDSAYTFPVITAITLASGESFVKYYVRKGTSNLTSTLNVSDNGSSYVSSELNLVFARMDAQKRLEMNALAKEELVALVKTANGNWIYLGFDNPVTSGAGTGETGTARSDANQYTSQLVDESNEYPHFVLDSVISGLLG